MSVGELVVDLVKARRSDGSDVLTIVSDNLISTCCLPGALQLLTVLVLD